MVIRPIDEFLQLIRGFALNIVHDTDLCQRCRNVKTLCGKSPVLLRMSLPDAAQPLISFTISSSQDDRNFTTISTTCDLEITESLPELASVNFIDFSDGL